MNLKLIQDYCSIKELDKIALPDFVVLTGVNGAGKTRGLPVTKYDNDVAIISGFSTNILENILTIDNYSSNNIMLEKLTSYLEMLRR